MIRKSGSVTGDGFTLLEVIIAITIFGICITLVYTLYSSVTSVVSSVEKQSARDLSAKIILDRVAADLSSVHVAEDGYVTVKESGGFLEEDPIVDIVTTAHLQLDPNARPVDISRVRYYLRQNDDSETYTLLRSDSPVMVSGQISELPEKSKHRLSAEVVNFQITCIGQDGEEYEEWDSFEDFDADQEVYDRFPRSYKILLDLGEAEGGESGVSTYRTWVTGAKALFEFAGE